MSLGPLTTNFVPPPSCTNSVTNFYAVTPEAGVLYVVGGPLSTSNCFPPHYEFARSNFYSPGICPEGYTSACSSLNTAGIATETVVTCCPSMFDCDTSSDLYWQATMGCSSSIISLATTLTVITNGLTATFLTTLTGGARNAYSVQVHFQASDFQSTTHTHSTTPASTSTSTPTRTRTSTVSSSGGGNITSGVAAAIGICSAIGAFLVSALIASIFFRRRRIERRQQRVEMAAQVRPNAWPHELPAQLQ